MTGPTFIARGGRGLERGFERAIIEGDIGFFDRVLAKDFTRTSQAGEFRNRKKWRVNHKARKRNYDALKVDQFAVRVYSNTAVVTARISLKERNSQGKPIVGQYPCLRVWVKQGDAWQVVGFKSIRVAEAEKGAPA